LANYFVPLASRYPANFEQLVAWTAVRLQATPDVNLVYVETAPQHHDVEYLLWARMLTLPYENFPSAAALAGESSSLNGGRVLAFIPAEEPAVATAVAQIMPEAWAPVTLSGPAGETWGYVVGNVPLPEAPDLTLAGGLLSAAASPAGPAMLILVLLLLGLGARSLHDVGPVWVRLSRRRGSADPAGDEKAGVEETSARYHVGFDLEVGVKRRRKK